ncbi:MAG TPA: DUF5666 domain-containing protein [Chloroflexota bacterium]
MGIHPIAKALTAAILLAGCGGSATPPVAPAASSAAANPSAAVSAPASKPAASAAASKPAASVAASGAAQANPTFTDGTVQALEATKLTLAEGGKTFTITPQTSFAKLEKVAAADVKPGQFVAITAKQQPDNSLLASFLRLQDSSGGRPASQFPMDYTANGQPQPGNLMVNALIKSADANGMIITLAGGDATVKYAPNVQIVHQAEGKQTDVTKGSKILIISRGDQALSVGIYA